MLFTHHGSLGILVEANVSDGQARPGFFFRASAPWTLQPFDPLGNEMLA